jgi:hypothetical protein
MHDADLHAMRDRPRLGVGDESLFRRACRSHGLHTARGQRVYIYIYASIYYTYIDVTIINVYLARGIMVVMTYEAERNPR